MYYPYLRGKQFELLALREFAEANPNVEHIVPIIEPVKSSFNGLRTAMTVMSREGMTFALVVNPNEGDFRRSGRDAFLSAFPHEEHDGWVPALLFNGNEEEIVSTIERYALKDVMIIFKDGMDVNNYKLSFLADGNVKYIVNGEPDSENAKRYVSSLSGKKLIRLDDNFKVQRRNVDYENRPDEPFTENHRTFASHGFSGFADYTSLPKDFIDGGMLPYAVAIHLTYERTSDEIYIHHFVSDTNDDQSNVGRKFMEAAVKVRDFFENKPKTPSIDELISILEQERYPGLGFLKKLSVKNHLELIHRII